MHVLRIFSVVISYSNKCCLIMPETIDTAQVASCVFPLPLIFNLSPVSLVQCTSHEPPPCKQNLLCGIELILSHCSLRVLTSPHLPSRCYSSKQRCENTTHSTVNRTVQRSGSSQILFSRKTPIISHQQSSSRTKQSHWCQGSTPSIS